jgi:hypothetical protein
MILKPGDKRLIQEFEELVDIIKGSTSTDQYESSGDKRKRVEMLLKNFMLFCPYYFPEYCYAPMAQFHRDIQRNFYDHPNNIFLEQLSRGFTKSTIFGLFMPLYIKFNGKLNGMIAGSLNEAMASEKLADIQANLQFNQRIINDFGEQFSYGNWEDGMFKTRDDVAFYAFGKKQSPRGVRFKWKRPNYGLVDDLNDARQLKNNDIALEDKRWVLEELKPALWTRMWWLPIAQNKFHENTVTALLEDDEEIKVKLHRVNIVDEKGNSNWPENPDFSKEAIDDLRKTEGAGFIRERMNTPFEEGTTFKVEWLHWTIPLPLKEYDGVLIHYLDPSYKSTDKSDYKAWVLLGKKGLEYYVLKAWGEKTTSKNMWEYAYSVDEWVGDQQMVNHSMEANFMQEEVHSKELDRVATDNSRMLRLHYDRRAKPDKFERIETMQPLFQRGLIKFNIEEKETTGMKLLRSQLLAIEKGSRINDDLPDALEGAIWMADRYNQRRAGNTRSGKYKKDTKRRM